MPRYLHAFCAVCLYLFASAIPAFAEMPGNAGFERGVNLSHWFGQIIDQGDRLEHLRTHHTGKDFDLIKSLGLDHVRFPVDSAVLEAKEFDGWTEYRRAVDAILDHGLNVIIDVHLDSDTKQALGEAPEAQDALVAFWEKLAGQFSDTDPARVRLELLNEPQMLGPVWGPLQARVVSAVRFAAPNHTLVICGGQWSGIKNLRDLEPVDDPNVVYNFHFYEPHQFTHQGATWGAAQWRDMNGLPYPATEEGCKAALDATDNPAAIGDIVRYSQSGWGPEKVKEHIGLAGEWAQQHGGLTLTCNEFGVYMKSADPEDRVAWLRDVREALQAHGIGWSMWDYAGGFGIVKDGKPIDSVVEALGLIDTSASPPIATPAQDQTP